MTAHQAESLSVSLFHNTTRIVFLVLQVSRAADKNNAGQGAYEGQEQGGWAGSRGTTVSGFSSLENFPAASQ
jgi:hypothetical protein